MKRIFLTCSNCRARSPLIVGPEPKPDGLVAFFCDDQHPPRQITACPCCGQALPTLTPAELKERLAAERWS